MIHDVRYTNQGHPIPLSHTLTSLVFPVGGGSLVKQFKQMTLKKKLNGRFWERSCSLLGKHRRKDCLICLSPSSSPWKGMWYLRLRQPVCELVAVSGHAKDGRIKACRDSEDTAEQPDQPWDNLPLKFSEYINNSWFNPLLVAVC